MTALPLPSSTDSFDGVVADPAFVGESQRQLTFHGNALIRDVPGSGAWWADLDTSAIERVSVPTDGGVPNVETISHSSSNDGRFVVFTTSASNIVPGDANAVADVFLRDRSAGETLRLSEASPGSDANRPSTSGVITADGQWIFFASEAHDLVASDRNGFEDVVGLRNPAQP